MSTQLDPLEVTRQSSKALEGMEPSSISRLAVGDRVGFVPTGRHERVARHLFRCEGTVTEVTAREVTIAWDACEDCGEARTHIGADEVALGAQVLGVYGVQAVHLVGEGGEGRQQAVRRGGGQLLAGLHLLEQAHGARAHCGTTQQGADERLQVILRRTGDL